MFYWNVNSLVLCYNFLHSVPTGIYCYNFLHSIPTSIYCYNFLHSVPTSVLCYTIVNKNIQLHKIFLHSFHVLFSKLLDIVYWKKEILKNNSTVLKKPQTVIYFPQKYNLHNFFLSMFQKYSTSTIFTPFFTFKFSWTYSFFPFFYTQIR